MKTLGKDCACDINCVSECKNILYRVFLVSIPSTALLFHNKKKILTIEIVDAYFLHFLDI